ncbi:hypothetical protein ACFWN7_06895 [Agromyces sp. NPDC058484]|uniref:hypothetical protein n=1 Tax=Agromyces sp. NPDC058484 TaxID=3346524 RepID=UPI00366A1023
MTEAQTWTMIGAFIALMFGMLTIVSTLFIHVLRTEVRRLETKFDARFDVVGTRIDGLDRDVQALVKHTFGIDRG